LKRSSQQLTPVGLIGHTVGAEQRHRLTEFQPVTLYRTEDSVLLGSGHGAQCMGKGGANDSLSKFFLGHWREPGSDIYPTSHPRGLVPELAGDTCLAQALFVHQRADHPCLIQCGERTRR